ncbi:Phosphatidylserine decarboxylase proenzyme [Colletotrichum gloeosporioides]|uniref:Phosphatidylserine decarboxylase proenzyme n=1 Tax=Colletotrichum gloeosporioides TaxID=474922 RepID=A0A8H4FKW0_COLGL|nr:Phosphatidylserine decarboxylase proenzyme [Colletotrichum gloeosporioides]KAF3806043.1 Phosphatidylserine decarboxylase proenzyme [Colletotrichum gloeosporioides]
MGSLADSSKDPRPFSFPREVDEWIQKSLVHDVFHNDLAPLNHAVREGWKLKIDQMKDWGIVDGHTFLLFASGMLRWVPKETCDAKLIYNALCMLNVILDQCPLDRPEYSLPISPDSVGKELPSLSRWLVNFSKRIGSWMDNDESITCEAIQSFKDSPLFNIDEAYEPKGGWRTFNEMFSRTLKKGMRPIGAGDRERDGENYNRVIVFPADSTFDGAWPVTRDSKTHEDIVQIKGLDWTIKSLLNGCTYADYFEGGVWMHAFLNTFDYHRQHAPVAGKVVESKVIPGLNYLNVTVIEDPNDSSKNILHQHRSFGPCEGQADPDKGLVGTLNAPDNAGYQFLQSRGCIVIHNDLLGYVAVLPVGMAQVSSVVTLVSEGDDVEKGQPISKFLFGGSDIVLVFQKEARVQILGAQGTDDKGQATSKQKYLVGMPLGYSLKGLV